ncbi:hypothetical protein SAY87_007025 [Trapa incisa]|uniref:Mediator of RNA polymerase II transcription subunit 20 n=1 Tax=Trapa incisa TaxID=236973 RepID=A0AAN7JXB1_9MYRT|nr:hypothetical protein SAY87_007025 [Trapa incisa]
METKSWNSLSTAKSLQKSPNAQRPLRVPKGWMDAGRPVSPILQTHPLRSDSGLSNAMRLHWYDTARPAKQGDQYQLGDFQLRVGKVVPGHQETLRGIVMEVGYFPTCSMEKSQQIMDDFTGIWQETLPKRSLLGQYVCTEPNFSELGLVDDFTPQDTAVQYAVFMADQMAAAQSVIH